MERRKEKKKTHSLDKRFSLFTNDTLWKSNFPKTDVFIHHLYVLRIKRTPSTTHFEKQDAQTPKIDNLAIASLIEQDFGSQVLCGTTKRLGELVRL